MREFDPYSDTRYPDQPIPRRRRRHRLDERVDEAAADDGPPTGDRWSTWNSATHGPAPRPGWVVTEHAAVDVELGVLKTGKEADVHLVRRAVPGTDGTLMAAKRYRTAEHRMFHRDAGYLEGRRVRRSRETRAMAGRTTYGRELLSGQWAMAEFTVLSRLWADGVAVPYPVQLFGTELLMEFVGEADDGTAAPRLAQLRPGEDELLDMWAQLADALMGLAAHGLTHGDLSAFNVLVHEGRLVLIDLPQVVDVVGNPQGPEYLARDVGRIGEWFAARGLPRATARTDELLADLQAEVGLRH